MNNNTETMMWWLYLSRDEELTGHALKLTVEHQTPFSWNRHFTNGRLEQSMYELAKTTKNSNVLWRRSTKRISKYTTNCRVYNSFDFDSDHRLVVSHMNTPGNKSSRVRKRKAKTIRKKLNYKLLENDDMCENLISKFSNSWDKRKTPQRKTPQSIEAWA